MRIHDVDARELLKTLEVSKREFRCRRMRPHALANEKNICARNHPDHAEVRPAERGDVRRMALRRVARRRDDVVEHHKNALAACFRICSHANGVEKIERAIRGNRGCRPHRARDHNRLFSLQHKIEEESRFLHRVGAVRDHDAVDIVACCGGFNAAGEAKPNFGSHRH